MKRLMLIPCALAIGALAVACSDNTTPTPPAATASISRALAHVPPPGAALPTGERLLGQSGLEAVYDADHAGAIGYVSTPIHVKVHADSNSWAPFYLVMYPQSAEPSVGTLLCEDLPTENCPDHGPELDTLAANTVPGVYTLGAIAGHDHIMSFPGGSDFNIAWEPVAVLFTNTTAANNDHLITVQQIMDAKNAGDVMLIKLPPLTFHCAPVSAAVWNRATPIS